MLLLGLGGGGGNVREQLAGKIIFELEEIGGIAGDGGGGNGIAGASIDKLGGDAQGFVDFLGGAANDQISVGLMPRVMAVALSSTRSWLWNATGE